MKAAGGVATAGPSLLHGDRHALPASGFFFDPNRCTGCAACALACSTENSLGWGRSWRSIVSFNPERRSGEASFHLSLACNHCDSAPCLTHCPTGALRRDVLTGAVLVAEARCIGCRYCAWVCPYDVPRFDTPRGVMAKCTLCNHRLREGRPPACVEACPTDALRFGPLRGDTRIFGFPDAPVGPRIRFAPLRRGASPLESTWSLPQEVAAAFAPSGAEFRPAPSAAGRASGSEWPLWLFTSGLAASVGWIWAAALSRLHLGGAAAEDSAAVPISLPAFGLTAALLLGTATLHLARPLRAWLALANVRSSSLSLEIAAVAVFLGASILWLAGGGADIAPRLAGVPAPATLQALGAAAAGLGLLALAAVDRVYGPVRDQRGPHPADTVLTGPLFAAALLRSPWLFSVCAAWKLAAAVRLARARSPGDAAFLAMRAATLAATPLLPDLAPGFATAGWVLLVAAVELADRARFYRDLVIGRTPPHPPSGGSGCSPRC